MRSLIHRGEVLDFDEARGLGVVANPQGRWPFHCAVISDGTRRIAVGTKVSFQIVPGLLGRWEADNVTPID